MALVVGTYEKWLTNGIDGDWIDIVSPAQLFSERYSEIKVPKSRISGRHIVKVLRHSTPIINFIILERSPSDREVYFGWVSGVTGVPVFKSSDEITIRTFEKYFKSLERHRLWGDPTSVDYTNRKLGGQITRSDLVDKLGNWVTLSIRDGKVHTFGFFKIELSDGRINPEDSGYLEIFGEVFTEELRFQSEINHGKQHIAHYTNKVFIEYGNEPKIRIGFCFYEFSNSSRRAGLQAEHIDGFFIDERDTVRNDILGFKVGKDFDFEDTTSRKKLAQKTLKVLLDQRRLSQTVFDDAIEKIKSSSL
ncbi:hypothetical protein [Sulfitobacter pacificus]|uniref:hypothetical protein n=1 Tax=Sulfitobacter pacificus TaxID=1499314 RepID=UPI003108EC5C